MQAGRVLSAVVYQPQHKRTCTAELGCGAWRDGVRLRREPAASDLPRLRGGVLRRFLEDQTRQAVEANAPRFGSDLTPATTCAGIEYPRMIEGYADFLLFWRTLAWDHAPGALLLAEAGVQLSDRMAAPTSAMTTAWDSWSPLTAQQRTRCCTG